VARLRRRLSEAAAALTTLDEALEYVSRSEIQRDSAILRLIYSYEAVWKACQRLLTERENIETGSASEVIRAARRLGWLSDEDADAAMKIGRDRNLAVHMYRGQIGDEIEERLAGHAAVLHRWLAAVRQRIDQIEEPVPSATYRFFEQAMTERRQILCEYDGYRRELCPIILGHSRGEEKALAYQFAGESRSGLPPGGEWKCLWLFKISNVQLRDGPWHVGSRHSQKQTCVEIVDLDVNSQSPYNPKRQLPSTAPAKREARVGRRGKVARSTTAGSRQRGTLQ
jgi:uncharacterized protein YutE (UPF0331/DUF86 family)